MLGNALKSLKFADIINTEPDKENKLVVMSKSDYFSKMWMIVKDRSKIVCLGLINKYNENTQVEMLPNKVLEVRDKSEIAEEVYTPQRSTEASRFAYIN